MDNYYVSKLIPLIAESGINVDRQSAHQHHAAGTARHLSAPARPDAHPRTARAGVNVALGQDCVMDPWYGLGGADMLDVAHMAVHAAPMTSREAIRWSFRRRHRDAGAHHGLEGYGLQVGAQRRLGAAAGRRSDRGGAAARGAARGRAARQGDRRARRGSRRCRSRGGRRRSIRRLMRRRRIAADGVWCHCEERSDEAIHRSARRCWIASRALAMTASGAHRASGVASSSDRLAVASRGRRPIRWQIAKTRSARFIV